MARISVWLLIGLLGTASVSFAVSSGQIDDFENGTVAGWTEGVVSPNPPTNIANGGPMGVGDNFLRNISSGGFSSGGKMVMFNSAQWNGNYIAAGISSIQMQLANLGPDTLFIRIAFEGSGTRYGSTTAFPIPPDSQWRTATFSLLASNLTLITGPASREVVLSSVGTMRINSGKLAPRWDGDIIAGTLGVDNILAVPQTGVGDPAGPPPRRFESAPNPFTTMTTFTYELPVESPVSIDIYDITGRATRQIMSDEMQPAGLHQAVWDGRDASGVRVPPGVYFARLSGPGYSEVHKLVVATGRKPFNDLH